MIAAIGLPNAPSIALHARFGFVEAGVLKEAGFKVGRVARSAADAEDALISPCARRETPLFQKFAGQRVGDQLARIVEPVKRGERAEAGPAAFASST